MINLKDYVREQDSLIHIRKQSFLTRDTNQELILSPNKQCEQLTISNSELYLDDLLSSVERCLIEDSESSLEFIYEAGSDSWATKDGYYVKQNGDVLIYPDRQLYDKQIELNKKSASTGQKKKHLYNYLLWAGRHAIERHNERKVSIKEIVECVNQAYPSICDLYKSGKLASHDYTKTAVIVKYMGDDEPPISIVIAIDKAAYYNKETNQYEPYRTLQNKTPELKIKTVAKYYDFASIFRPDGKRKDRNTGTTAYEYHIFLDEDGRVDKWQKAKENALYMRQSQDY